MAPNLTFEIDVALPHSRSAAWIVVPERIRNLLIVQFLKRARPEQVTFNTILRYYVNNWQMFK
jgi:hypothetical protein